MTLTPENLDEWLSEAEYQLSLGGQHARVSLSNTACQVMHAIVDHVYTDARRGRLTLTRERVSTRTIPVTGNYRKMVVPSLTVLPKTYRAVVVHAKHGPTVDRIEVTGDTRDVDLIAPLMRFTAYLAAEEVQAWWPRQQDRERDGVTGIYRRQRTHVHEWIHSIVHDLEDSLKYVNPTALSYMKTRYSNVAKLLHKVSVPA